MLMRLTAGWLKFDGIVTRFRSYCANHLDCTLNIDLVVTLRWLTDWNLNSTLMVSADAGLILVLCCTVTE